MDPTTIIREAFDRSREKVKEKEAKTKYASPQKMHAMRSQEWVKALALQFQQHYTDIGAENIRVFSKYCNDNRGDFGLNELLFDIAVVKTATISSTRNIPLTYIEKALWIVESEMAKDTRQLVLDFSKLVMGDAENKLFVGPFTEEDEKIIEILKTIAMNCNGDFWLSQIPHPGKWNNVNLIPEVQKLK